MGIDAVGARAEGHVILGYDSFRPSTFVDAGTVRGLCSVEHVAALLAPEREQEE